MRNGIMSLGVMTTTSCVGFLGMSAQMCVCVRVCARMCTREKERVYVHLIFFLLQK